MIKRLPKLNGEVQGEVAISGSKSESNRLLILKKIFTNLELENLSNSDDTNYLKKALAQDDSPIDISHAGTAMRFLTAYFSAQKGREVILTGSHRMQNRPIGILVEALRSLGAEIHYVGKEGYPPLKILGKRITENQVKLQGNVSSQYISALLLMAPSLVNGLRVELVGEVTSVPYIKMTLSLLQALGIHYSWVGNTISVEPQAQIEDAVIRVESDWSSASYFYSLVALSENAELRLTSYKKNSLQGDRVLETIYKKLGVETHFEKNGIRLRKIPIETSSLEVDLVSSPDLAQTVAVTCFGLGIRCDLTGLHTLKIKETDRLVALDVELKKLGAEIRVTDDSLHLEPGLQIKPNISIDTYDDHRMAMAFAPLALKVPLTVNDAEVVSKSYTDFWKDFEKVAK